MGSKVKMEVGCSSPNASAEGASRWTAQMDGHRTVTGNGPGNRTPLTGQLTHPSLYISTRTSLTVTLGGPTKLSANCAIVD